MYSNSNQSTQSHSRWENSKWTKWNGTLPAEPTWKRKSHRKTKTKKAWRRNDCHLNNTCVSNAFITVVCDVYEKWDCINCMEIPWKNLRKGYWEFRKCMTHPQTRLKWYVFLLIGVLLRNRKVDACKTIACWLSEIGKLLNNIWICLKHRTFCSFLLLALCFFNYLQAHRHSTYARTAEKKFSEMCETRKKLNKFLNCQLVFDFFFSETDAPYHIIHTHHQIPSVPIGPEWNFSYFFFSLSFSLLFMAFFFSAANYDWQARVYYDSLFACLFMS